MPRDEAIDNFGSMSNRAGENGQKHLHPADVGESYHRVDLSNDFSSKDALQIDRDVPRTFQFTDQTLTLLSPRTGETTTVGNLEATEMLKHALRNVLIAYSRYDKSIGYVQGMNLIAGAILFHCQGDEVSAFWIFVSLIENYEMRQIYQKGLPGLDQHGEVVQIMI